MGNKDQRRIKGNASGAFCAARLNGMEPARRWGSVVVGWVGSTPRLLRRRDAPIPPMYVAPISTASAHGNARTGTPVYGPRYVEHVTAVYRQQVPVPSQGSWATVPAPMLDPSLREPAVPRACFVPHSSLQHHAPLHPRRSDRVCCDMHEMAALRTTVTQLCAQVEDQRKVVHQLSKYIQAQQKRLDFETSIADQLQTASTLEMSVHRDVMTSLCDEVRRLQVQSSKKCCDGGACKEDKKAKEEDAPKERKMKKTVPPRGSASRHPSRSASTALSSVCADDVCLATYN